MWIWRVWGPNYSVWVCWIYFTWNIYDSTLSCWKSAKKGRIWPNFEAEAAIDSWINADMASLVSRVCWIHFTWNIYDSAFGIFKKRWKTPKKRRICPIFEAEAANPPYFYTNGCPECSTWDSWVHFIWNFYNSACSFWKNAEFNQISRRRRRMLCSLM